MNQTVIFPSCQWFKESGLAVSNDGWILYGGPSKSLCILEPLSTNNEYVGQEQKYRALVIPRAQGQKIICLAISPEWPTKRTVITGTADGSVKQWSLEHVDDKLNVKATHAHELHRAEKEEVAGVGYGTAACAITVGCYGTLVKWDIDSNVAKNYNTIKGFKPTCLKCSPHLPMHVAVGTKQGIVLVLDLSEGSKILYKVRAHDEEIYSLSWCPKYEVHLKKALKKNVSSHITKIKETETDKNSEVTHDEVAAEEVSNCEVYSKNSSQVDSSEHDETEVLEDDMFDIYKDHEPDEFGHKKYQPEEIFVKVKDEQEEIDYLTECRKLKDDILKRKNDGECSIQSLVDAMDKAQLNDSSTDKPHIKTNPDKKEIKIGNLCDNGENQIPTSVHIHKHLLASVGKQGSVRIWSKAGNLVANGVVQKQKGNNVSCVAILWYKPHKLLVADGRGALIECNPIHIDYKNSLEWKFVHHIHTRGLYCITSGISRKQDLEVEKDWPVWTVGQDRKLVQYSLKENKPLAVHTTCGGFIYNIAACPYDANKIAVSVGDGAVRVWHASETADSVLPLTGGDVLTYWQNVLGKVLTIAWHPTQENLLAFGTAESRVGVIDTSGRVERPARALPTALGSGVYALSWAANKLYAVGGGQLVYYQPNKPHKAAEIVPVVVEGREWRISNVIWSERALVVGAADGAVAVLEPHPPHQHRAHAYPFSKLIYTMEWHPLQVSSSNEESVHKNEMAVCSLEKNIVIVEFKEGDKTSLAVLKTLEGHHAAVNRVCWSPHHEARLLSASNDNTFRVWNTAEGVCIGMYVTPGAAALSGVWSPDPAWAHCVMTGGADCCVRVWDTRSHLYNADAEVNQASEKKKKRGRTGRKKAEQEETKEAHESGDEVSVADTEAKKLKVPKKFLLPLMSKQLLSDKIYACRKLFEAHLTKLRQKATNGAASTEEVTTNGQPAEKEKDEGTENYDCDFIKIFGSTNDVNEFLDMEQARHAANGCIEPWILLALIRGDVAGAVAFATQREVLSPFLLSLTPCVSFKYWKDTQQLYLMQMEKFAARGDEEKSRDIINWGGLTYKRAVTLLALHEVGAAVDLLSTGGLHKEAYALCRARHLSSLAEGTLRRWADYERFASHYTAAAACYLALGDVAEAAAVLGKSALEEHLQLAAEMARFAGQNTYAAHIACKGEKMRVERESNPDLQLPKLPSRVELLESVSEKSQARESE